MNPPPNYVINVNINDLISFKLFVNYFLIIITNETEKIYCYYNPNLPEENINLLKNNLTANTIYLNNVINQPTTLILKVINVMNTKVKFIETITKNITLKRINYTILITTDNNHNNIIPPNQIQIVDMKTNTNTYTEFLTLSKQKISETEMNISLANFKSGLPEVNHNELKPIVITNETISPDEIFYTIECKLLTTNET